MKVSALLTVFVPVINEAHPRLFLSLAQNKQKGNLISNVPVCRLPAEKKRSSESCVGIILGEGPDCLMKALHCNATVMVGNVPRFSGLSYPC